MKLLFGVRDGDPVPQPRPRFTRRGFAYTPSKHPVHAWKAAVLGAARAVLADLPDLTYPRGGPFWVSLGFSFGVRRYNPDGWGSFQRGQDVDNLAKAVLDALLRVVWWDDRQIVELCVRKIESPRFRGCLVSCADRPAEPFAFT